MEKAKPGLVRIMLTRKQQPTKSTFVRYENQCHQNGAVSFTSRPGTGRSGGWSVGRREALQRSEGGWSVGRREDGQSGMEGTGVRQ